VQAKVGDELLVENGGTSLPGGTGAIVAVRNRDGSPPHLVHWLAGDHDSLTYPWPGVRIESEQGETSSPRQE
jgi:Domain of unknown function (DUF1918)